MKILAIETSCDETGISIIEAKNKSFKILADSLSSQVKIHAPYGGVYPMLAKREHMKNLPILLEKVLKKTKIKKPDLITVTAGPGLEPALWTGIVFAKELGEKWNISVMPVNHMEGHILSVFVKEKGMWKIPKIKFPILSLLVSGGHTELVLIKDWQKYKVIGETLDDAAGEAFDKVARMMSLPYPGGPQISKLAEQERKIHLQSNFSLPRPMMHTKNFDFSFSGLKTAVLYFIRKIGTMDEKIIASIALEFENAVVETLVHKTKKAAEKYGVKNIIVAGGVSANKHLRKEIKKAFGQNTNILFPVKKLTTDNAMMIGIAGYMQFVKNGSRAIKPSKIKAIGGLRL